VRRPNVHFESVLAVVHALLRSGHLIWPHYHPSVTPPTRTARGSAPTHASEVKIVKGVTNFTR
jgi:hypothetical protein